MQDITSFLFLFGYTIMQYSIPFSERQGVGQKRKWWPIHALKWKIQKDIIDARTLKSDL